MGLDFAAPFGYLMCNTMAHVSAPINSTFEERDVRPFLFVIMILAFASPAAPAAAYLEPGTASMIVQMLIGGIAGIGTALALYWQQVKSFFTGKKKKDADQSDTPEGPSA